MVIHPADVLALQTWSEWLQNYQTVDTLGCAWMIEGWETHPLVNKIPHSTPSFPQTDKQSPFWPLKRVNHPILKSNETQTELQLTAWQMCEMLNITFLWLLSLLTSIHTSINKAWEHNNTRLDTSTNTGPFWLLSHLPVVRGTHLSGQYLHQHTILCHGNHPQVTNLWWIHQTLQRGFRQDAKYKLWCSPSRKIRNSPGSHPTAVCASACLVAASSTVSSETRDTSSELTETKIKFIWAATLWNPTTILWSWSTNTGKCKANCNTTQIAQGSVESFSM